MMLLVSCSACNKMSEFPAVSPFLCMDLTYITCLLKDGFGFKDSTVLQVREQSEEPCFMTQQSLLGWGSIVNWLVF